MPNNSLTQQQKPKGLVEYDCYGQHIKLSPQIVRAYLVNGDGRVSDQEVVMFMQLCQFSRLNPFLREAYLIKYGNQPASMVVGKDAFEKRGRRNKTYKGKVGGVCVQKKSDGMLENRVGALVLPDETLVGGWARVYIDGDVVPVEVSVSLDEYIGTKKDGTVNAQWSKKPATMIRKVAIVQALREAFPEDLGGMYSADEMGVDVVLSEEPIVVTDDDPKVAPEPSAEGDPFAD